MESLIPVQSGQRIVAQVPIEAILANKGHYHLKYNKRGNLRRAIIKQRRSTVPLSHKGESFVQNVGSVQCWALRGVTGSK